MKNYLWLLTVSLVLLDVGCVRKSDLDASLQKNADLEKQVAEQSMTISKLQVELTQTKAEIAQLQPLAAKARTLPVTTRLVKGRGAGYTLFLMNEAREALRFSIKITSLGKTHTATQVVDGGHGWPLPGLASSDTVEIESEGYDPTLVKIP